MTVDNYKIECLLELLNTDLSKRKRSFTALAAVVLISNVYAAPLKCTWLWWLLHQLIGAMKKLIKCNYY